MFHRKIVNISKIIQAMALKFSLAFIYAWGNGFMSKHENCYLRDCSGFLQIGSHIGQIEQRSLPVTIHAGPVNVTEGSYKVDSSECLPMEDRPIFQTQGSGTKLLLHGHRE